MHPDHKLFEATYFSLKEHLDILRQRPGMYFGEPLNVASLSTYLAGYEMALFIHNIREKHSFVETTPRFHEWVAMKAGYPNSSLGWQKMITEATQSDEEELNLFFRYYDEYVAREATVLFEYTISQNDIHDLVSISGKSDEEKRKYIGCKIQIISYDASKSGVFQRSIDETGENIYDQYIFHPSYEIAIKSIKSNLRVNFEQNFHRFRIACAWEKYGQEQNITTIVAQSTKVETLQLIRAEKGNIKLSIDNSYENEWQNNMSGLASVAEKIVELSVDPKCIQVEDLTPFINLKILHLAFGQIEILPKLEALTTLYLTNWKDSYTENLPKYFPNLKHIDINFFNEENLQAISLSTQLKHISLHYGGLKSLAGIEQLLHLEELHISMIGLEDVTALKSCPQLKILHLESHSKLLETIDLSGNPTLLELKIEYMPNLKNITINQTVVYSLEKIYLGGTKSLESLEWISHCAYLKELALSFKHNTSLSFDASKLAELTHFYCDCELEPASIQQLLSNTSLTQLFLSHDNPIHDFDWLTQDHQLQRCYLYFSGDAIDWDKVFSCLPNNHESWQIECTGYLKTECTIDEIKAIAEKYGHDVKNIHQWPTKYPMYRF